MKSLRIPPDQLRYRALIGTGGIGSGTFFQIRGEHTLGREESRGGRFLDRRDYCKLHIITHYIAVLLGPDFVTLPVGLVGDDAIGRQMSAEMVDAGMNTRFVKVAPGHPTLYSFCFVYSDGSGGNLTTDDSASSALSPEDVAEAEEEFQKYQGQGVVLAAPEVPLAARAALLQLGRKYRFFNVATFTSEEIRPALDQGLIRDVDLLALNRHEAAMAAGMSAEEAQPKRIAHLALEAVRAKNSEILLSITAGPEGNWSWDGHEMRHRQAVRADVVSTAGAGDSHLGGLVVGLTAGLTLAEAQDLATLLASFKITSPHTIHPGVSREALAAFARQSGVPLPARVQGLLEDQP